MDIMLIYLQMASVISGYSMNWPKSLLTMQAVFSVVNFDVDYITPECLGANWTYLSSWTLQMFSPFIIMAVVAMLYGAGWVRAPLVFLESPPCNRG